MHGYTNINIGVGEGRRQHVTSNVSPAGCTVTEEACVSSWTSSIGTCDGQSTVSTANVYCVCRVYVCITVVAKPYPTTHDRIIWSITCFLAVFLTFGNLARGHKPEGKNI